MASLSTCHLGLWLGWQILLKRIINNLPNKNSYGFDGFSTKLGNLDVHYKMGDTVLGTTVKEKDLGQTTKIN